MNMQPGKRRTGGGGSFTTSFLTQSDKTTELCDSLQPSVKSCEHVHTCLNRNTCSRANKYIRASNEHNVKSGTYVTLMHTRTYIKAVTQGHTAECKQT